MAAPRSSSIRGSRVPGVSAAAPDERPQDAARVEVADPAQIAQSERLVLPGVGAFKDAKDILQGVVQPAFRAVDTFTTPGVPAKELGRELGAAGSPREELDDTAPMLRITGLRDYAVLAELKARVTEILGANGIALERRLGRGVCVLALHTSLPAAELRSKLEGLPAGGRRLSIREAARDDGNRMEWEAEIQ